MLNRKVFLSKNLKFARQVKCLTMADLASKAEVTRQAISNYEKGLNIPSSEVITRFILILDKPRSYFYTSLPTNHLYNASPLFFRKFTNKTKKARLQSKVIVNYSSLILNYLYNFFELPIETNIFQKSQENIFNITNEELEEIANNTRKYFGLGVKPINNLQVLLENNFFIVCKTDMVSPYLDAFSFRGGAIGFIFVNKLKNQYACRYRFTLAHELGHLILHNLLQEEDFENRGFLTLLEKQADYFSGAFLMPRESFLKDVFDTSLQGLLQLKKKWQVSVQAMIYRLYNLGVIDEKRKKYLMIEISRKGYRKLEPFDKEIEVENPQFMSKAFNKISKIKGYESIVSDLNMDIATISELTNIDKNLLKAQKLIHNIIEFPLKKAVNK